MKRVISILFLLVYLDVGFGTTIDYHYCGGKLVDLKICGIGLKDGCPMKSMHASCCKHGVHFCNAGNHKSPTVATVPTAGTSLTIPVFLIDPYSFSIGTRGESNTDLFHLDKIHRPSNCPLFVSNMVFRI